MPRTHFGSGHADSGAESADPRGARWPGRTDPNLSRTPASRKRRSCHASVPLRRAVARAPRAAALPFTLRRRGVYTADVVEIRNSRSWIAMSSVSHRILDCDVVGFPLSAAPVHPAESHADRHGVRPGRGDRTPTPMDPSSARPRRPSSIEERNEAAAAGGGGGVSGASEPWRRRSPARVQRCKNPAQARRLAHPG